MNEFADSRRQFVKRAGMAAGSLLLPSDQAAASAALRRPPGVQSSEQSAAEPADYTLQIQASPIEIAPDVIRSTITYNGQFPGPLLRFKEGRQVTVDVLNDTDTPEQLHWHGQKIPSDVDGAAEEGTPYIPAHGKRRINFKPNPAGFRFYHTHTHAMGNLFVGAYTGQAGPVYIEPKDEAGRYDREVFLTLKEFGPVLNRGGDMAMDFLDPAGPDAALKAAGESTMRASLEKGMPHGYEVGYTYFTINGKMLGHGEPIRVKEGERVLLHVLNASATEIRSLALPGHFFEVVALDGNPVPNPTKVPVLWLGTAERVSAIVEMTHPGVWILGDLDDDDRNHGMGIVVEYSGRSGKPQWSAPHPFRWSYRLFGKRGSFAPVPDGTFEMRFTKRNAAYKGFNLWAINGTMFPMESMYGGRPPISLHLKQGKRYRLRMHNATDDIHPVHLHRHIFELKSLAGVPTAGVQKDVVMLGGYQTYEVDFVADNPGLSLFHCHQQLHMDFGFMAVFNYL